MKDLIAGAFLIIWCSSLIGCKNSVKIKEQNKKVQEKTNNILPLVFNTEKDYPVKEYRLEDIAEISYIPLETPKGKILGRISPARWSVTKEDIFLGDLSAIFRFDKNGRFLNTIGKKGHGPGEYTFMHSFCVNEQKREVYITAGFQKQILIYTYKGEYKYSIPIDNMYSPVLFDSLSLIVCKSLTPYNDVFLSVSPYQLISLKDGRLLDSILPASSENPIPAGTQRIMRSLKHVLKFRDEYILTHYSQDTVFTLKQDGRLVPRYIKEPSNVSLAASRWFYDLDIETDYFAVFTLYRMIGREVEQKTLLIDKNTKEVWNAKFNVINYFLDSEEEVVAISLHDAGFPNLTMKEIYPYKLIGLLKQGKLEGELKEIASGLTEDSNPVLMVVKFKDQPLK